MRLAGDVLRCLEQGSWLAALHDTNRWITYTRYGAIWGAYTPEEREALRLARIVRNALRRGVQQFHPNVLADLQELAWAQGSR